MKCQQNCTNYTIHLFNCHISNQKVNNNVPVKNNFICINFVKIKAEKQYIKFEIPTCGHLFFHLF